MVGLLLSEQYVTVLYRQWCRMEDTIQPLEVVALTVDIPELNLQRGQVGTVVDVLSSGRALEVEFSDREGRTYASLGLRPDQVMVLRYEPQRRLA
jgi:hypothetical protein